MNLQKAIMTLAVALSGAMASTPASAQTVIVQMDSLMCALLPAELQHVCLNDFGNGGTASREEAVRVCARLSFSSDRNQCYGEIQGQLFSRAALAVCDKMSFSSDTISCLREIRNGYYQESAINVCGRLSFSSDTRQCMNTIRNKYYEAYELQICDAEAFSSDTIQCMARFGVTLNSRPRPVPMPMPTPVPAPIPAATCDVHNSSSYITTIRESQFMGFAVNKARQENTCVVLNYHNQTRSRTLLSASGRVLGSDMSEKEANDLKKAHGYSRCAILTCK